MTSNITGVLFTLVFFSKKNNVQGLKEDKKDRYCRLRITWTNPGGHSIYGFGLQPLVCWDRGFESHCRQG
jgi:hypothetical protein